MIVLISKTDPLIRIVLDGPFEEDDRDILMRQFPDLRVSPNPLQMSLLDPQPNEEAYNADQ